MISLGIWVNNNSQHQFLNNAEFITLSIRFDINLTFLMSRLWRSDALDEIFFKSIHHSVIICRWVLVGILFTFNLFWQRKAKWIFSRIYLTSVSVACTMFPHFRKRLTPKWEQQHQAIQLSSIFLLNANALLAQLKMCSGAFKVVNLFMIKWNLICWKSEKLLVDDFKWKHVEMGQERKSGL